MSLDYLDSNPTRSISPHYISNTHCWRRSRLLPVHILLLSNINNEKLQAEYYELIMCYFSLNELTQICILS